MNLVLVNQGFQIININMDTRSRYFTAHAESDNRDSDYSSFITLIAELELKAQVDYMDMIGLCQDNDL
jgi:hypothetical protein